MSVTLLLSGATTAAYAAPNDFISVTDSQPSPFNIPRPSKSYIFDNKGRWGVKLDFNEPVNRDTQLKDVTAGAYFRIGPRLKLGGSVGLGDKFAQPQQITPQDTGPRVHLETKFQF